MSRVKTTLKAPDGVTESIIEGTYYWPDENGDIETTNVDHVKVLQRHGYQVSGVISIMQPASVRGPIDIDELGKAALSQALSERGLSYPDTASRSELAEIAAGWNLARRRGHGVVAAATVPTRTIKSTAIASPPAAAAQAEGGQDETGDEAPAATGDPSPGFADATYDELKGWLSAHGIAYPPNTAKKVLLKMAEDAHAALIASKAKKSEAA